MHCYYEMPEVEEELTRLGVKYEVVRSGNFIAIYAEGEWGYIRITDHGGDGYYTRFNGLIEDDVPLERIIDMIESYLD